MAPLQTPGLFITFEGIDGSGKSTQAALCEVALGRAGYKTLLTRNPGGTALGEGVRDLLLHRPGDVSPIAELLLYLADRAQHMQDVLLPALAAGTIVLCDRHLDSTVAYQGYGRGLNRAVIDSLNALAIQGRKPDLTLLFDGPPEALLLRARKRGEADRLEREHRAFYEKVAGGYRAIAAREPDRVVTLEALLPVEALHQEVLAVLRVVIKRQIV